MIEPQFLTINKYIQFLRKNYKRTKIIHRGFLYTYPYFFNRAPGFKEEDFEKIKFYDFFPLVFVFDVNRKNKTFVGLNFHHLPVKSRQIWLKRVQKIRKNIFEREGTNRVILKYNTLKFLVKKSMFGIRQYRFDRIGELRMIPNQDWEKLFSLYGRTYYGVSLRQIEDKYKRFVPKF